VVPGGKEREVAMALSFDYYKASDGLAIRWGCSAVRMKPARGTILFLNGRTEYMEKYAEVVEELDQRGLVVYSCDWRGQGLSGRMLADRHKGHVVSFEDYLRDLDQLMEMIRRKAPAPIMILGHSMGGHIAARLVERYPGFFDRVVMTSPMIDIQLPWFLPRPMFRWLVGLGLRQGRQDAYALGHGGYKAKDRRFEENLLTADRFRFERNVAMIQQDPRLAVGGVTYGWLNAALQSIDHVASATFARSFRVPLLMVTAAEDRIVCERAQAAFCRNAPDCRMARIEGARHELLVETDPRRQQFWKAFDHFLEDAIARQGAGGNPPGQDETRSAQKV